MVCRRVRAWVLVCALALVAVPAMPQIAGGALTGTIADRGGAAVPGATVTVTATGTNRARTVGTDEHGMYAVLGLAPGQYRVQVDLVRYLVVVVSIHS